MKDKPNDKYEKGNSNVEQNDDATKDCPCKGQNPIWPLNPADPKPLNRGNENCTEEKTKLPVVR